MNCSKGVSVIICCYNSAQRLPETLKYLSQQVVPANTPWEVIIVDNASIDNTSEIAYLEWEKYVDLKTTIQFRIVEELTLGLSYARERGVKECEYEYIIFCDDDNWLSSNYVYEAYNSMESNLFAGVIGGIGFPVCESNPPEWFKDFENFYATGAQGNSGNTEKMEDITFSKKYVYGASAVFRKIGLIQLQKIGYKSILSDRLGDKLISGGDVELCYALILIGYKILYNPKLKFRHFIPAHRLTSSYFFKLNEAFGYSWILLLPYMYKLSSKSFSYLKTNWMWLFLSSLFLLFKNDFKNIIFKKKGLKYKISIISRKGTLKSIWENRDSFRKNFNYINTVFKSL